MLRLNLVIRPSTAIFDDSHGVRRDIAPENSLRRLQANAPEDDVADLTGSDITASCSSITASNTTNILLMSQGRSAPRAALSDPPPRIRVVNPNSNEDVTRGLDAALEPLRFPNGPEIVCSTLAEGPFGIETQADVESVVMPLRHMVEADNSSDAFVIDPTQAAVTMALGALQFSRV